MESNHQQSEREEANNQDLNFPTQPKPLPNTSPLHYPSCLTCLEKRGSPGLGRGAWTII